MGRIVKEFVITCSYVSAALCPPLEYMLAEMRDYTTQTPPSHEERGLVTIERFLGCAESAVLTLNNPMK